MISILSVEANKNKNHKYTFLHVLKNFFINLYIYNFYLVTDYLNHKTNQNVISSNCKTWSV